MQCKICLLPSEGGPKAPLGGGKPPFNPPLQFISEYMPKCHCGKESRARGFCNGHYSQWWRQNNAKRAREGWRRYYRANKQKFIDKARKWEAENRERYLATGRKYRKEHRDEINEKRREWRRRNPEKVREWGRKYRKKKRSKK